MTDAEYTVFLEENKATTEYQEVKKPEERDESFLEKITDVGNADPRDSMLDAATFQYNKQIAQPLREILGSENEQEVPWYQPDTVQRGGKKYATKNKIFNDMTPQEMAHAKYELAKERSDDPENDPYVYELSRKVQLADGEAELFKPGLAKHGAPDRYRDNPLMGFWDMDKNVQTKNASKIEKLMQGNLPQLEKRMYDYASNKGKDGVNPLGESRTEIYSKNVNKLFDKVGTGTSQTTTQSVATEKVATILEPELQAKTAEVRNNVKNKITNIEKPTREDFWTSLKSIKNGEEFSKALSKQRELVNKDTGTLELSPSVMPESILEVMPQYQEMAQKIDGTIFDLGGYKATPQEKAKNLSDMLSGMNWNMTTLFSKIPQLKGSPELAGNLADALEAYNATDTDGGQVGRGGLNMLQDPSNAIGLAISGVGKLIGKNAAKKGLISQLRSFAGRVKAKPLGMAANIIKSPTSQAGTTGAAFTGAYDAGMQSIKISGSRQDEFNFEENGKAMTMGFALGTGLAKTISAFTAKANVTPQVTINEFDTMIAQMTKKAGDHKIDRTERGLYRKEVVRMRKYRDKVAAIKKNADARAAFNEQQKILEKMKIEIAQEARKPKAHPNVAKFYGLESFEKTPNTGLPKEKNAAKSIEEQKVKNAELDIKIADETNKIESPSVEKPIQESESVKTTKFDDNNKPITETRKPLEDEGVEIDVGGKNENIPNKKKEIIVEERGASKRGYQEDGYLQGHQQGKTGFAQTKRADLEYDPKSKNSIDDYITEKMIMFQQKDEMIKTYGQNAAKEARDTVSGKPKSKPDYTPEEMKARRASYELNEIDKILADKNIGKDIKATLVSRGKDIITATSKIRKPGKVTQDLKKQIRDYYDNQYKAERAYDNSTRNTEIGSQYKFLKDAGNESPKTLKNSKWSNWSQKQQYSPYNSIKENGVRRPTTLAEKDKFIREVYRKAKGEHRKLEKKIGQLEDRVKKQLLAKGIKDNLSILPIKGVDMSAVKKIQRYRDLSDDIHAFENKKIKHEEFLFRETERMDSDIKSRADELMSKHDITIDEAISRVAKDYDKLGIGTKSEVTMGNVWAPPIKRLEKVSDGKYKYGSYEIEKQPNKTYNLIKKDGTFRNFKNRALAEKEIERIHKWIDEQKAPERAKKKAEREAVEVAKINEDNKRQVTKFEAYKVRNSTQKRKTATNRSGAGKKSLTKNQEAYLDAGITPQQLADMQFPSNTTKETLPYWKKYNKQKIHTQLNENRRSELGVPSVKRFMENPSKINFDGTMIDASNSMLQMMAVLTRSTNFGKYSKLMGEKLDARTIIGDRMEANGFILPKKLNEDGKPGNWKDFVKPLFMTENYGQGEKGLVRTLQNLFDFEPDLAKNFYDAYVIARQEEFPAIGIFKNIINERMKYPEMGKDIHWTMPDGDRISLKIEKEADGMYSIRSEKGEFNIKTNDLDTMSSSLMPSYIQSYDAWVAKKMREKGYLTNHDAFVPNPKHNKTELDMQKDYGEILGEILNGDSFNKNLKEMMPETTLANGNKSIQKTIKQGTLTKDDIMNSGYKMEVEHSATNGPEDAKVRKIENEKWKTDEELMRDFMASSNMRQISTHSLTDSIVDNIGFNADYAKVMSKQDPFERQAALATKFNKYQPEHSINAPANVDKKVWEATQRNIFYESRAKLEQNPNAKEVLESDRIFFQENGKPIGDNRLTKKEVEQMFRLEDFKNRQEYNKNIIETQKQINDNNKRIQENIIKLENAKGEVIFKNFTAKEKQLSQRIGKTYLQMARRVKRWNESKLLNDAESFAVNVVEEARTNIPSNGRSNDLANKKKTQYWQAYYIRQVVENKPEYKQLQELNNLAKKYGNDSARYKEELKKHLENDIPEAEREIWTKHLLETDYASIHGHTRKSAQKFMNDYADTYKSMKKYIDEAADALGKPEKQIGYYTNNATGIARKLGKTDDMIPIIDQLISMKAMTDEAWKFVENKIASKDKGFTKTIERIQHNQMISRDILFKNNPEGWIKGYTREVTNPNLTLDKDGKSIYETSGIEKGYIPLDRESKKRGREIEGMNPKEIKEYDAEKQRLKISGIDTRKVAGEEIREDLERSHDIVDILAETFGDTEIKMGRRKQMEDMKKGSFDLLYSDKEKPGFVKLDEEVIARLPRELRENITHVRKEFYTQLMGRESVSFTKNASQNWKVVDRLLRDVTTRFKKNNVLSNSASHVNALMYNQMIAPSIGIRTDKQVKYQKQAIDDMKEITRIYSIIADYHSRGKDITRLMKKLEKNELYLMEKNGLSTNTIDGISQAPDLWRQMLSDGVSKIENKFGTKFNKSRTFANNIFAEGDSYVGQKFNQSFTMIDTSGRYMTTKHFMSPEGGELSMVEATRKSNGLFGDMDQIAPELIDFLDKYPAIPFMKWWTSIAPQTVKTLGKENFVKSLLVAITLYSAMEYSKNNGKYEKKGGVRTTGANPWFGNIDFIEGSTIGFADDLMNDVNRNTSITEKIARRASKYVAPSFITKNYWKYHISKNGLDMNLAKDMAKSVVISNAEHEYKNIKGAPLDTTGISGQTTKSIFEWLKD